MSIALAEPVVKVSALNFWFGQDEQRRQILHDINFRLFPGEVVILEGPSGSGKTTLLTLISGLRTARDGSVQVFGQEICNAGQSELIKLRRRIGYIFQHHNLLDFLSTRRNVELMFQLIPNVDAREARSRTESLLSAIGLQDHIDALPGKLSGGQRQRVAIARALVTNPGLVLADEPTAALDKTTGRQVVELLQQLARMRSIPILVVTHDNRILDIAERIIRMEDGRLIDVST